MHIRLHHVHLWYTVIWVISFLVQRLGLYKACCLEVPSTHISSHEIMMSLHSHTLLCVSGFYLKPLSHAQQTLSCRQRQVTWSKCVTGYLASGSLSTAADVNTYPSICVHGCRCLCGVSVYYVLFICLESQGHPIKSILKINFHFNHFNNFIFTRNVIMLMY